MNVAHLLLNALDDELHQPVDLTLYGRAAICLGFDDPPAEAALSKDIDAVLWFGQAEELLATNFWQALDSVNERFRGDGFFISHLFGEEQVILGANWKSRRKPIAGPWRHLTLHRLGNIDLLLSKLMRNDPTDRADAEFIYRHSGLPIEMVQREIAQARVPAIPELEAEYRSASAAFLKKVCG